MDRTPEQEIIFQEGHLLGLTEGMWKCQELTAVLKERLDMLEKEKEETDKMIVRCREIVAQM
jgi:hypothetical protein